MNSEMTISVKSSPNNACAALTFLLVDGDSTCLTIISKMLCRFGYNVMTAKRATDAFCIIQDRQYKIDLVLAEGCLPDMDKYELLETIKEMSEIPVILMSADNDWNTILGGLFKGAVLYLVKPITMDDLKNLWQFAFIKERGNMFAADESIRTEESSLENTSDVRAESQPHISEERQNHQSTKRERSEEQENNQDETNDGSAALKKPKLIWTEALHNRFLQAIEVLGFDEAHPKKILQYMNVPGLKKENVSSHLQKYRLSLKREQDANKKTMNGGSTALHVASHHILPPFSPQERSLQFSNLQFMTVAGQPVANGLVQENLNCYLPMPSFGSANLLKHVDSSSNGASTIKFDQQVLHNEPLASAYPECNLTGGGITDNEGLVGFPQLGDLELEQFLEAETDLLNNGDCGLESLLDSPKVFDNSLQEKQQQEEQLVLPGPLQLPPPAKEQEEADVFGAEGGTEFNEVFTMEKGTGQLFFDEDFDGFW